MLNILRLLLPDVVIEIHSSDKSKNYKVHLKPDNLETHSVISFLPASSSPLNYRYYSMNTCARTKGIGFQRFAGLL